MPIFMVFIIVCSSPIIGHLTSVAFSEVASGSGRLPWKLGLFHKEDVIWFLQLSTWSVLSNHTPLFQYQAKKKLEEISY